MTPTIDLPPGLAWTKAGGIDDRVLDVVFRARHFARSVLRPAALELDARMAHDHDYFPWDIVRAGAREGWLNAGMPPGWGGMGLGIVAMSAMMEEMCAADAGTANIFGAHGLGLLPIMLSMDMELGERVLRRVARGASAERPILCAFAITEPGGGSDVEEADGLERGDVRTWAERVPGGYQINGRKVFISNGNVADYVVVFAALDRKAPLPSWTAFVVERGTPGFVSARVERKMGQRACPAAELVFDDVFVPTELRVGAEGAGWEMTRQTLAISRGPVGAIAVGIARDAYAAALEHLRGAPEQSWQRDLLAKMVVLIRQARAAYVEAALHCDQVLMPSRRVQQIAGVLQQSKLGRGVLGRLTSVMNSAGEEEWAHQSVLGSTAKIAASDAAMWVTTTALDLVPPGAGQVRARVEKAFRDAKLTQIYEGTNQINLRSIAHETWLR